MSSRPSRRPSGPARAPRRSPPGRPAARRPRRRPAGSRGPSAWNVRTRTPPAATPSGASAASSRSAELLGRALVERDRRDPVGRRSAATSHAIRATSVVVLPDPAGATQSTGPGGAVAAARWSVARRARRSATAADGHRSDSMPRRRSPNDQRCPHAPLRCGKVRFRGERTLGGVMVDDQAFPCAAWRRPAPGPAPPPPSPGRARHPGGASVNRLVPSRPLAALVERPSDRPGRRGPRRLGQAARRQPGRHTRPRRPRSRSSPSTTSTASCGRRTRRARVGRIGADPGRRCRVPGELRAGPPRHQPELAVRVGG